MKYGGREKGWGTDEIWRERRDGAQIKYGERRNGAQMKYGGREKEWGTDEIWREREGMGRR